MNFSPENIILGEYLKNEHMKYKHRKHELFLRYAITNVKLAQELDLKDGLVYDCKDAWLFNMKIPENGRVFTKHNRYDFFSSKVIVAAQYIILKNNWIKKPVKLDDLVEEVSNLDLTRKLNSGFIRNSLKRRSYSEKIFKYYELENRIEPRYLPTDIKLE